MSIPSAYGATILNVERLEHPKGLLWAAVTWEYEGRRRTAKTVPGSTANRQAREYDRAKPARILLNGRSQIALIEPMEEEV